MSPYWWIPISVAILLGIILILRSAISVFLCTANWWFGSDAFYQLPSSERFDSQIMLTFDDVPWKGESSSILQMLDICKRNNVPVLLFVIGDDLRKAPRDVVDGLREHCLAGDCFLGNHGRTDCAHSSLPIDVLREDILSTEQAIQTVLGPEVAQRSLLRAFRPGHGLFTKEIAALCRELNYRIVLGDTYTRDPFVTQWWFHYVAVNVCIGSRSVMILHDRPHTPEVLRHLLPSLIGRGYRFVSPDHAGICDTERFFSTAAAASDTASLPLNSSAVPPPSAAASSSSAC